MKILLVLCAVMFLSACSTTGSTVQSGKLAALQADLNKIIQGKLINSVKADAQATLKTIQAQLSAGQTTALAASQRSQCPTNILALIQMIQGLTSTPIPQDAGVLWLSDQLNGMGQQGISQLTTQVNLIKGSCQAMLPGLQIL